MLESLEVSNVGPHKWRAKSFRNIKKLENHIEKIEKATWRPDKLGATLIHKEVCAELGNQEALRHGRAVRSVVVAIQECVVESNEEIKKLRSLKDEYERMLYNVEMDSRINKESRRMRDGRPYGEGRDGTDDLLNVEAQQLREMKRHLDSTLKVVKEHLTIMNECRKKLLEVQQERKTVLDIVGQRGTSRPNDSRMSSHSNGMQRTLSFTSLSLDADNNTDPLSAFSPSCKSSIQNTNNAIRDSQIFRDQISNDLNKLRNYRNKSERLINNSFVQKLGETQHLKNQLNMARVRARSANNKAQRWYNLAEKTMKFNQGPDKYQDLMSREKLDRPVIKVFQRHPGTQLPEAQHLIRVDSKLRHSVTNASRDIERLKTMDATLIDDIYAKNKALEVDRRTLRWRRCKSREMRMR